MKYLGNLTEDQIIDFHFSTHKADGTPITLAGTPAVKVYKGNSTTTETATGITLDVDFDSVTGMHHVRIDTSADAFYAVANDYSVVITTGTVDGTSVVGTVLATFSIENRYNKALLANGAHGGAAATLQFTSSTLGATTMINAAGVGLAISGTTGGMSVDASAGNGLSVSGETGITATGTTARAVWLTGATSGVRIVSSAGPGIQVSAAGIGIDVNGTTNGLTIDASAGDAVVIASTLTNGNAVTLTPDGTGLGINSADVIAILADTAELQTDWHDGGRLDLQLDAAVSNAGTGARTVTITVNDGTTALESASVRMTKGAETYIQTTNVSGVATFNVDDGTWTVAITMANYSYAGTTLVVDGDETATYSMTAIAIAAPAGPGLTTGYILCLGTDGLAESGVTIKAKLEEGPGTAGHALDTAEITMTSGVDGVAQHTGFVRGAWYKFRRGASSWTEASQAADATTWELSEILGNP